MARKKEYPGGFRLTLATARKLAVQEFGTAKGLKQGSWHNSEGFYEMTMGNLEIEIHPDMSCSGCIQIDIAMQTCSLTRPIRGSWPLLCKSKSRQVIQREPRGGIQVYPHGPGGHHYLADGHL